MVTIWQTLGIVPTGDEKEIRRAYARQLKQCRPETHPENYQRLREAFEEAKRRAKQTEHGSVIFYDDEEEEDYDEDLPSTVSNSAVNRTGDTSLADTGELLLRPKPSEGEEPLEGSDEPVSHQLLSEMQISSAHAQNTISYTDIVNTVKHIAITLAINESEGMDILRTSRDQILLSGSLSQQQQFHQALSCTLANMQGLTEESLIQISDLMGWRLKEDYASPVIPFYHQKELEEQLIRLERASLMNNEWRQLEYEERHGGFVDRYALQALKGENPRVPLWYRLVPGLVQTMSSFQHRLSVTYPELLERLNPSVLIWLNHNPIAISRLDTFLFFFWMILIGLAVSVSGSPLLIGVLAGVIALTYLFIRRLILRMLSSWSSWTSGYYLIECLLSLCLIVGFFIGLYNAVIGLTPDDGGGSSPSFGLELFLLTIIHGLHEAVKDKPLSHRPGLMVSLLFTGPGDLLWRRNARCFNRFLFILYCAFGLAIAVMLFHLLTSLFF